MRSKLMVIMLVLGLAAPAFAQSKVIRQVWGTKKIMKDSDRPISAQVLKPDKPRILLLVASVADVDGFFNHFIDLSNSPEITFYIDYTATFATDVRFHFIWNGPEIYMETSDWFEAKYKRGDFFGFVTDNNWKKGVYTLTIIAEQATEGSGADSVATCRFRFF